MGGLAVNLGGFEARLPAPASSAPSSAACSPAWSRTGSRAGRCPTWARGLMPVLVIPLLTTLIAGCVMIVVLGKPIGWLMDELNDGLNNMSGSPAAILLGVDPRPDDGLRHGRPAQQGRLRFAAPGLGGRGHRGRRRPELKIMAAVMLAGMVPPIALALATVVRPRPVHRPRARERQGRLGPRASFITEGAIPFAAADPLRVIPSIMLGSAVTGGLSEAFDVALRAPHGGIFVLFAVDNILGLLDRPGRRRRRRRGRGDRPQDHRPAADAETSSPSDCVTAQPHQRRSTMPTQDRRRRFRRRPARPPRRDHLGGSRRAGRRGAPSRFPAGSRSTRARR